MERPSLYPSLSPVKCCNGSKIQTAELIINIYAPTNITDRKRFFSDLNEYFFSECQIIGGDFDCIDSDRDKYGGSAAIISEDTKKLKSDFRLIDVWLCKNPTERQFTWFNSNMTIGSRLDKYFISKQLLSQVCNCQIFPCFFSDHDFVSLRLNLHEYYSHGPGMWRLSTSLLEDEIYCKKITELINDHKDYEEAFSSKKDMWEFLKASIKEESIAYSKAKHKQMFHERTVLTKRLIRARQAFTRGDQSVRKTIQMLENQLKTLSRREIGK